MCLHEDSKTERARPVDHPAKGRVVQRLRDEQHGVGAGRVSLNELIFIDDHVLAQDRHVDGLPHGDQVLHGSSPVPGLGQDRDRGRARAHIAACDRGGVGGLAESAEGGRAALHLRDHGDAISPQAECPGERPYPLALIDEKRPALARSIREDGHPHRTPRVDDQLIFWHARLRSRDVSAAFRDDLLEKVTHAVAASAAPTRWLTATKRTSASLASPLSIA